MLIHARDRISTRFNLILVVLLAVSFWGAAGQRPASAQGSPTIDVQPADGSIGTWGWAPGIQVTLTIDDPFTEVNPDYTETAIINEWGDAYFYPSWSLVVNGAVVTASDGTTTRELVIKPLGLDLVAYSAGVVYGNGEPGDQVAVFANSSDGLSYAERRETIDIYGQFQADFSITGNDPGEEQTLEMDYGTFISAAINDTDGDRISQYYQVKPFMVARLNVNRVLCRGWEPGKTVTLEIDDPEIEGNPDFTLEQTVQTDLSHFTLSRAMFNLDAFTTLRPGMQLTLSDGYFTKTMEVFDMTLDVIDPAHDLLGGTAEPNSLIGVFVDQLPYEDPSYNLWVLSDEQGRWEADFTDIFDINYQTEGTVRYFPVPGENQHTRIEFEVPPPASPDQDGDEVPDLEDPCPGDPTNTCNPAGSAAALVSPDGGMVATEDQSVAMDVPAGALAEETVLTITDGGTDVQLTTELGVTQPAVNVQIGPDGTQFAQPVAITLQWEDANNDGVVDGQGLEESELWLFKDGAAIAGPCISDPGCDRVGNTFTVQVTSLSEFVLGVLAAPEITQLAPSAGLMKIDTPVTMNATIQDAESGETYAVTWDWGDGTSDAHSAVGPEISAQHAYGEPGVYTVGLTVVEEGLDPVSALYEFVVVYDPQGGFVTGGGWFWSPPGAYLADPSLEGKASFGFVSRYKKGSSLPDGNTEFQLKAGGLNFHSESYDWLVVNQSSARAQYKGRGTVNGSLAPNGTFYKFMVWAVDGAPDSFRMKIWWVDGSAEHLVYDNGVEMAIGGGSIVVHKK